MGVTRFNLNLTNLDTTATLIHGAYGAGKTHLQGDFLRWAAKQGPVAFLNIKGEDGFASIAGMDLGDIAYTAKTLPEYDEIVAEFTRKPLFGLAVDSLTAFNWQVLVNVVGSYRYPDPKLDGERSKMLWGTISTNTRGRVLAARAAAKHVLWVAPQGRNEDISGGRGVTPELIGQLAWGCAGLFDFVGKLDAAITGPKTVDRKVSFDPENGLLTRQRAPRQILGKINIPEGGGGWEAIFNTMQAAFAPAKGKA